MPALNRYEFPTVRDVNSFYACTYGLDSRRCAVVHMLNTSDVMLYLVHDAAFLEVAPINRVNKPSYLLQIEPVLRICRRNAYMALSREHQRRTHLQRNPSVLTPCCVERYLMSLSPFN